MKKQIKKTNKKQQSGRSMIEMVGVLAVMGLITAGAFVLISSANSSSRRNRVVDDVMNIAAGVRALYADADALPTTMPSGILTLVNGPTKTPYNSDYTVTTDTNTTFKIAFSTKTDADCKALAAKQWKDTVSHTTTCTASNSVYPFEVVYGK